MTFKEKTKKHINNSKIFKKLEKYVFMIEEKNKVINLTGFTGDELWKEGIYESIIILETLFDNYPGYILDIGAGAGFPSIPYIIANFAKQLTIYEPMSKRFRFLQEVSKELDLSVDVQKIRVEDSKELEKFDFITARAVSGLKELIEISNHVGKIGSKYAFIKGKKSIEEIYNSRLQISIFKVKFNIVKIKIGDKENSIIFFKKKSPTPKGYPRTWSIIKRG